MADNVVITAGTGTTVHADEYTHGTLGSGKTQLMKLVNGTLDSDVPIVVDVGAKANALRVCPASDITDGTYIGDIKFGEAEPNSAAILADTTAILADTAAIQTAVELLDNAVDGNYLNVNSNIAGTDVVGGAGAVAAGVQRVTLATDDPAVVDLAAIEVLLGTIDADTSNITACNTGAVVLASGTVTTVSTVTNLSQLGGVAISMNEGVVGTGVQRVTIATDDDSVAHLATIAGDTTSLDTKVTACNTGAVVVASGAITETNSASLAVVGGGAEATALRVTLANDSTGVITVDGTVTAELSATDNAVLDAMVVDLAALEVDLAAIEVLQTTIAGDTTSLDSKVTACNTGAVVVASGTITAELSATDNAVLDSIVINTARTPITNYGQAKLDHADVTTAQVLAAAVADEKFYITSLILSVAAAGSYWIEDDDAAQITCKYTFAANGGMAISFPIDTPYKSTTANKGLKVKGSAAGVVGCQITYYTAA